MTPIKPGFMVEQKPYLSARIGVNHLRGLLLFGFRAEHDDGKDEDKDEG